MYRAFIVSTLALVSHAGILQAQSPSFARDVRPFLAKYCVECHNPKSLRGGLDLESFKGLMAGGDKGIVLVPGSAKKSKLVTLTDGSAKPVMPPRKIQVRPTKKEIDLVRAWVDAGARDDSSLAKITLPDIKTRNTSLPPVRALAYTPGGDELAVGRGNELMYLNVAVGRDSRLTRDRLKRDRVGETWKGEVTALAYAPTGNYCAVAFAQPGKQGGVVLSELVRKNAGTDPLSRVVGEPITHDDAILDLAFSRDGKTLATASYDTRVKLIEVPTGKVRVTLKEHSDSVYGVAFSPDGKQLASCSADRALKVWNASTGKLLYTLGEATEWLYTVAWSPDGSMLASGGVDKSIRVYRPGSEGARLIHAVFAHDAAVQKLVFSADSRTLYSVGQDGVIKAWDVRRMTERKIYDRQPETVLTLAVHPTGKQFALGRFDGIVQLIDGATGKRISEFGPLAAMRSTAPKTVVARTVSQSKEQPKKASPKQAAPKKAASKKVAPKVNGLSPTAVSAGKTTAVEIRGSDLDGIQTATIDLPGSKVEVIEANSNQLRLKVTPPRFVRGGTYTLRFTTKGEKAAALSASLIVDPFPAINESEPNDSPGSGQTVSVPASVVGTLDRALETDYFRIKLPAGYELGVHAVSALDGSKFTPFLQLLDSNGRLLADSARGFLGYRIESAGVYVLGIHDREYRGSKDMSYRLHIGNIPVVTSLFPMGLQQGTTQTIDVAGVNLSTKQVAVDARGEPGSKVRVPVKTPSGLTPLGNLDVVVGEFPETREGSAGSLATIAVPGTGNGRLLGEAGNAGLDVADVWQFRGRKGQRLIIEAYASRLGTSLDSAIEILDAAGNPIEQARLRCLAKTVVNFRDHDSVTPAIRIEAWDELATNDYIYLGNELIRIEALPPHPDSNCTFFSEGGKRQGFFGTTPTHHSVGVPLYKVAIHPPGTKLPPNGFPVFTLYYRNDDGGQGYGTDSRVFFDPPADGMYRIRIRDSRGESGAAFGYRLTVRPPRPSFNIRLSPGKLDVPRGGAVPLTINADRIDGYDGPIHIEFHNVPAGFHLPATSLTADENETAVALYADAEAKTPGNKQPLKMIAWAEINGTRVVKEVTGPVPEATTPGDIMTYTVEDEIGIKPGGRVKLTVHINRRNGFKGRIPLDVRGLPHGVKVLDVGLNGILINENEVRRTIVLEAEPWLEATHPFVVLGRREGKNTQHAARTISLKILK